MRYLENKLILYTWQTLNNCYVRYQWLHKTKHMKKIKVSSKRRYNIEVLGPKHAFLKMAQLMFPSERAEAGGRATRMRQGGARGAGMVVYGLNWYRGPREVPQAYA